MKGAKGVIRGETWRDPASLLASATQEDLGRAGEGRSWGRDEGGKSPAGVLPQANSLVLAC